MKNFETTIQILKGFSQPAGIQKESLTLSLKQRRKIVRTLNECLRSVGHGKGDLGVQKLGQGMDAGGGLLTEGGY